MNLPDKKKGRMTHKRGQAAMEFLMTYGWAILVVLVVIGALAYFGILNPQTLLPERCELQQGFYCEDYRMRAGGDGTATGPNTNMDTVSFSLENGRGSDIMIQDAVVRSDDGVIICENHTLSSDFGFGGKTGFRIANGASGIIVIPCQDDGDVAFGDVNNELANTGKRKFAINITWGDYSSASQFNHTMEGQLLANIEE